MLWGMFGGTARQTVGSVLALLLGLAGGWYAKGVHTQYLSGKATLLLYNATGYPLEAPTLTMPDGSSHPLAERLGVGEWLWDRMPQSGSGGLTLRFGLTGEGPARSVDIPGGTVGRLTVFDDAIALTLTADGFVAVPARLDTFREARRQAVREEWRNALRERLRRSPTPTAPAPPPAPASEPGAPIYPAYPR